MSASGDFFCYCHMKLKYIYKYHSPRRQAQKSNIGSLTQVHKFSDVIQSAGSLLKFACYQYQLLLII